jgi:hypothetical protein
MFYSSNKLLLEAYCIITQFVPSDTKVAESPTLAARIAVPADPPPM